MMRITNLLVLFACISLMPEVTSAQDDAKSESSNEYYGKKLVEPRENDVVLRRGESGLELYSVIVRKSEAPAGSFVAYMPLNEYTCDHDPPKPHDSCTCGNTGIPAADYADCALLEIDCAPGKYDKDEKTCSDWDGDPLPPLP